MKKGWKHSSNTSSVSNVKTFILSIQPYPWPIPCCITHHIVNDDLGVLHHLPYLGSMKPFSSEPGSLKNNGLWCGPLPVTVAYEATKNVTRTTWKWQLTTENRPYQNSSFIFQSLIFRDYRVVSFREANFLGKCRWCFQWFTWVNLWFTFPLMPWKGVRQPFFGVYQSNNHKHLFHADLSIAILRRSNLLNHQPKERGRWKIPPFWAPLKVVFQLKSNPPKKQGTIHDLVGGWTFQPIWNKNI